MHFSRGIENAAFKLTRMSKKTAFPHPQQQAFNPRTVACPACSKDAQYAPSNPYRPFCSARCKGIDLGAWANEAFRVPVQAPPDDSPWGDSTLDSTLQ
jgi:endogenous inhibitor of DNA gyrase (YacG/DUF329 family)